MREIKFRVWDKKNKEMHELITWHNPAYLDSVEYAVGQSSGDIRELRQDKNCVIMQFTGLKDKNGKEIYEGDIVKEGEYDKGKSILYIIEWKEKSAGFGWHQIIPVLTEGLNLEESEVIGNIYENPELIK